MPRTNPSRITHEGTTLVLVYTDDEDQACAQCALTKLKNCSAIPGAARCAHKDHGFWIPLKEIPRL
ncbi:hypothetical protein [Ralstonia phage RpY2]|uniref:Uncharacterized protein n=1 Tax=Ralstonia phage RpY2 TaxID=2880950 RepID=A0AC61TNG0_9CAUD|nr:hypothetical protein [Ralstonia phage RpY2]